MKNKIIIGSRGSKLALVYAERARKELLKIQPQVVRLDIQKLSLNISHLIILYELIVNEVCTGRLQHMVRKKGRGGKKKGKCNTATMKERETQHERGRG